MPRKRKLEEQRHFIRHPMCFPLRYKIISGNKKGTAEKKSSTINISRGGLLFSSKRAVDTGSIIMIKIPFQNKIFSVRAMVVRCVDLPNIGLYEIGVKFMRHKEAFKVKLIEQMYLISEYRDLTSVRRGREMSLQEASKEWIKLYSERFKRLYW